MIFELSNQPDFGRDNLNGPVDGVHHCGICNRDYAVYGDEECPDKHLHSTIGGE